MKQEISLVKALADENRMRIVCALLENRELCVCYLIELLEITGATVSRHLSILTNAGIISHRKQGRWMIYRISEDNKEIYTDILQWVHKYLPLSDQIRNDRDKVAELLRISPDSICRKQRGKRCCPEVPKIKILFLCTGNSCRSQMAEGWARYFHGDRIDVFSAGIEKHGLNPLALQVMKETGVDISGHYSKTVSELPQSSFDYVITVCGHASENCPFFPGKAVRIHAGFEDPPKLAAAAGTEEEILNIYRKVRDEIREFVLTLPGKINL